MGLHVIPVPSSCLPQLQGPVGPSGSPSSQHRRTPELVLQKSHASFRITKSVLDQRRARLGEKDGPASDSDEYARIHLWVLACQGGHDETDKKTRGKVTTVRSKVSTGGSKCVYQKRPRIVAFSKRGLVLACQHEHGIGRMETTWTCVSMDMGLGPRSPPRARPPRRRLRVERLGAKVEPLST